MSFSGEVRDQNGENVPTHPSLTEGRMSRRKRERRGTVSRALCGHVCLVRIAFIAYYAYFTEIESGSTSPHRPLHMRAPRPGAWLLPCQEGKVGMLLPKSTQG